MKTTSDRVWISRRQAATMLGVGRDAMLTLVAERRVTTRQLPGLRPQILRADVERLALESVRLAEPARA